MEAGTPGSAGTHGPCGPDGSGGPARRLGPVAFVKKKKKKKFGRQSCIRKTSSAASPSPVFPGLPLDLVCAEHMSFVAGTATWAPYRKREHSCYRFPTADFVQSFAAPVIPDAARDGMGTDGGSSSAKKPFSGRSEGTLEDTLKRVDTASRLGLRASSFSPASRGVLGLGLRGGFARSGGPLHGGPPLPGPWIAHLP